MNVFKISPRFLIKKIDFEDSNRLGNRFKKGANLTGETKFSCSYFDVTNAAEKRSLKSIASKSILILKEKFRLVRKHFAKFIEFEMKFWVLKSVHN